MKPCHVARIHSELLPTFNLRDGSPSGSCSLAGGSGGGVSHKVAFFANCSRHARGIHCSCTPGRWIRIPAELQALPPSSPLGVGFACDQLQLRAHYMELRQFLRGNSLGLLVRRDWCLRRIRVPRKHLGLRASHDLGCLRHFRVYRNPVGTNEEPPTIGKLPRRSIVPGTLARACF